MSWWVMGVALIPEFVDESLISEIGEIRGHLEAWSAFA
jgi:hypothetical protein